MTGLIIKASGACLFELIIDTPDRQGQSSFVKSTLTLLDRIKKVVVDLRENTMPRREMVVA